VLRKKVTSSLTVSQLAQHTSRSEYPFYQNVIFFREPVAEKRDCKKDIHVVSNVVENHFCLSHLEKGRLTR